MMKQLLIALTLGATLASPAAALEPLSQNKYINDRLVAARVADRIRRECPTISARMIYAFQQARKLKKYAEDQGYSGDQIDAYLDSRPDKDRIYGIAEKYLKQEGAKPGDAESFCRVGRSEIEKNTVSGTLLSAK